jgi:hypothetical protein
MVIQLLSSPHQLLTKFYLNPSRRKSIPCSYSSRWEYHWNKARFVVSDIVF